MAQLAGRWNLMETEGFDEYMKALGVGFALRKMGNLAKPTQEITIDGDKWNIKTLSTFKNTDISFTVGQEFEETTADGRKVMTICTVEGDNKMVQTQKGEPDSVLTREVTDNAMVMTCVAKEVTCTRKYTKAES